MKNRNAIRLGYRKSVLRRKFIEIPQKKTETRKTSNKQSNPVP